MLQLIPFTHMHLKRTHYTHALEKNHVTYKENDAN